MKFLLMYIPNFTKLGVIFFPVNNNKGFYKIFENSIVDFQVTELKDYNIITAAYDQGGTENPVGSFYG